MRHYIFILLTTCLCAGQIFAQSKGVTRYELDKKGASWPNTFVAGENVFYFLSTLSGKNTLWIMDGKNDPETVTLPSKYNGYIAPLICEGDNVLLSMTYNGAWHLCRYNPKTKNITELITSVNGHMFLMAEDGHLYFHVVDASSGKNHIARIDLATLTSKMFVNTENMALSGMIKAGNDYYVCAITGTSGNIYIVDTNTQSLSNMLVPQSNNKNHSQIKMFNINGVLYFFTSTPYANYQLYRYKGGPFASTEKLTEFNTTEELSKTMGRSDIVGYNGKIYFTGPVYDKGLCLMSYDTTFNIIEPVYPSAFHQRTYPPFEPSDLYVYKTRLYMTANDEQDRPNLYTYSGTDTPWNVAHIQQNRDADYKRIEKKFFTFKGDLYFRAAEENGYNTDVELYRYNDSLPDIIIPKEQEAPSTVYPNPTNFKANLYIQLEEEHTIQVVIKNISGVELLITDPAVYEAGKHIIELPTYDLEKGIYFYNVLGNRRKVIARGKILKQ